AKKKCPACPSSCANVNIPRAFPVHVNKMYECAPYGLAQNAPDCFPTFDAQSSQRSEQAFFIIALYSIPKGSKAAIMFFSASSNEIVGSKSGSMGAFKSQKRILSN